MAEFANAEAARLSGEPVRFSFGRNWKKFLADVSDSQLAVAAESLSESFEGAPLAGHSFLDVGCGSGIFSLCASRAGARRVVSVDIDPNSVACAAELHVREGRPSSWSVRCGSVLSSTVVESLPVSDRVYCWGTLHHTGAMWSALEILATRVAPGGLLCVALYNAPGHPKLHMRLKRTYNRAPRLVRLLMVSAYASFLIAVESFGRQQRRRGGIQSPWRYVAEYRRSSRGMSFWRDMEDWLGGLPCEFADKDEVTGRAEALGLEVVRVLERPPGCNNEYLLRRVA
jgi:2-polyprenyl-3-methyl-5-hydroxy-6-metoxy-1,4-benzoquinol methylase